MLVALVLVVIVVALFVSNYMSAFKTGAKGPTSDVSTGISAGKSSKAALPSPTPGPGTTYNMTAAAGRYPPPRTMIPALAPPQVQPPVGMEQPYPGPSTLEPTPTPTVAPQPRPAAEHIVPVAPTSPYYSQWYGIMLDLLRFFPSLFSGQHTAFPQWPRFWF